MIALDEAAVLTVREVAAILRIGRNQAYERIAAGQIPAVRIGRTIRVPAAAIRRLLDEAGAEQGQEALNRV